MLFAKNKTELAGGLGITPANLTHWLKRPGNPGEVPGGGYDIEVWRVWHDGERAKAGRAPRHGTASTDDVSDSVSLQASRARKAKAEAEIKEMAAAEMRGDLIRKEVMELTTRRFVGAIRERLLSVKAQAPKIALLGGDVVAIETFLHEQICDVLTLADEGPIK